MSVLLLLYSGVLRPEPESWMAADYQFAAAGQDHLLTACRGIDTSAPSRLLGGVPGFYVFENMWFSNDTFYLYGEGMPEQDMVMSGRTKLVAVSGSPGAGSGGNGRGMGNERRADVCFTGSNILFNAGSGSEWSGLYHYYHFVAESLLGALAAYASITPGAASRDIEVVYDAQRLVIPWDVKWREKGEINAVMSEGMFREPVVDREQWARLTGQDKWIFFERVAFIDRSASHRHNPSANQWGKMAVPILTRPFRSGFFSSKRLQLLSYYGISPRRQPCPKIVYIDRQKTNRRMPDDTHEEFVKMLDDIQEEGWGRVQRMRAEEMEVLEQIRGVADASVMVGIHGNGLSHQLWMERGGFLIELYPSETFLRDFEIVAQTLGHEYQAVAGAQILPPSTWGEDHREMNPGRVHDGTPVNISVPLVKELLLDYLRPRSAACRHRLWPRP